MVTDLQLAKYQLIEQVEDPPESPCFHLVPVQSGLHLIERGTCWCDPTVSQIDPEEEGEWMYPVFLHKPYTPKGENGPDGI